MNQQTSAITPDELWAAINGNPGIRPTKNEALEAAKACADAVDEADNATPPAPAPQCIADLIGEAATEAAHRYPPDRAVDDPIGETGAARTDEYGYQECARRAFAAGAQWACLQGLERLVRNDSGESRHA